jgi:Tfp pilus assembly protein PilP
MPGRVPHACAVVLLAALGAGLAGCGGDDGGAAPPPANPATPRPGAPGAVNPNAPKPPQLPEKMHVEDRVVCPVPDRPSDPKNGKCDLKAPSCGDRLYCLALAQGSYCEPCPERYGIRHAFRERDFAGEQNRDPFQSFLLPQLAIGKRSETMPIDPTKKCPREDQMIATSYSYNDLRLVGIVAQGTQRKVLMMGGPLGYIIKRGDCVGKEKAFVKDIGTGYITFLLDPDTTTTSQRVPEEYSVQLNPKQLAVNDPELPSTAPRTSITPVVAPPAVLPSRAPGAPAPPAGSGAGSAAAPPPVEAPAAGKRVPVELPPGPAKKS